MGTPTAIASQIFNAKADYVLALKGNLPTLHDQVKTWFEYGLYKGFEGSINSYDERVYPLSYRNLEEMMLERGLTVDHTTVY